MDKIQMRNTALAVAGGAVLALGGVLVERSNAKTIMLATNIVRAIGIVAFIFVAPTTATANVPLVYLINFGIATATAIFAPAELTSIPRIVDRRNLMAANSIFVLTINATFATRPIRCSRPHFPLPFLTVHHTPCAAKARRRSSSLHTADRNVDLPLAFSLNNVDR